MAKAISRPLTSSHQHPLAPTGISRIHNGGRWIKEDSEQRKCAISEAFRKFWRGAVSAS